MIIPEQSVLSKSFIGTRLVLQQIDRNLIVFNTQRLNVNQQYAGKVNLFCKKRRSLVWICRMS